MSDHTGGDPAQPLPRVIVLSRDLFFGMRIRNALKQMGYVTVIRHTEADVEAELAAGPAVLVMIDFNTPVDWSAISTAIASHGDVPTLAFGPHTDTEAFRQAREAGITRVISNGAFSQQLPDLVTKYAAS